jgi:uncharacterized protein YjbI with pentapeptide repeats
MYANGSHEILDTKRHVLFKPISARSLRHAVEQAVESKVDLAGADLSSAYSKVDGGIRVSSRLDLSGANLRGARLEGARLNATDFSEASLNRANLTNAWLGLLHDW